MMLIQLWNVLNVNNGAFYVLPILSEFKSKVG